MVFQIWSHSSEQGYGALIGSTNSCCSILLLNHPLQSQLLSNITLWSPQYACIIICIYIHTDHKWTLLISNSAMSSHSLCVHSIKKHFLSKIVYNILLSTALTNRSRETQFRGWPKNAWSTLFYWLLCSNSLYLIVKRHIVIYDGHICAFWIRQIVNKYMTS